MLNFIQISKLRWYTVRNCFGFSLLELLFVVLIVGILIVVALPSYHVYIAKGNRADAKLKLSEIMFEQERHQLRKHSYTTDLQQLGYALNHGGVISDLGFYRVIARRCRDGSSLNRCIELHAEPLSARMPTWERPLMLDSRDRRLGDW